MGVGVAAAVGVFGAILLLMRRRRKAGEKVILPPEMDDAQKEKRQSRPQELATHASGIGRVETEGTGNERQEMATKSGNRWEAG